MEYTATHVKLALPECTVCRAATTAWTLENCSVQPMLPYDTLPCAYIVLLHQTPLDRH